MTNEESAALMADMTFRGRIKVSCLKFATSILDEASTVQGHSARYRWAQTAASIPDQEAARVQPMVVMDGQVQLDGANITDAALQTTVETVVSKFL